MYNSLEFGYKTSHVNTLVVDKIIKMLEGDFGKEAKLTNTRGMFMSI